MSLFSNNSDQPKMEKHSLLNAFAVDLIKWEPKTDEEASIIVHKFEAEDFPSGSQLIVHPSQIAVFVNNIASGNSLNEEGGVTSQVAVFIGPCKAKLETGDSRFAPFRNLSHTLTNGESAYHSTVYFINATYMNELNWGTHAPIVVSDPEEEVNVHVRAFGLFGVHIEQLDTSIASIQATKFLRKIVGTRSDYTRNELVGFMRAKILEYVPDLLAECIVANKIGVMRISAYLSELSADIQEKLMPYFDEFGLSLDNFSFHNINVPEEDLISINEMKIQKKRNQLEAEGNAVRMDIESAARARMREREGFTYQQEKAYGVMHAAAENEGSSGSFLGAGMGLGMGVGIGNAFGSGINSVAQDTFDIFQKTGSEKTVASENETVCPACNTKLPKEAHFCYNCGEKIEYELICPDCGTHLVKGARYCYNCGRKMIDYQICPKCGAKLSQNSKFCMECGEKL